MQYTERVIQTLLVYLELLACHLQVQLFTGKGLKIIVANPPPQTFFQKLRTRGGEGVGNINCPMK